MNSPTILVVFAIIALVSANVRDRRNSYGDELVTPAGGGAPPQYVAEVAAATVAPAGGGAQTGIQSSGYRKKRDATKNAYEDDIIV